MPNIYESRKIAKEMRRIAESLESTWSTWLAESSTFEQRARPLQAVSELPELRINFAADQKAQFHIKLPQEIRESRDAFVFHFLSAAIQSIRDIYPNISVGRTGSSVHFSKATGPMHIFVLLDTIYDGNLLVVNVNFSPLVIHEKRDLRESFLQTNRTFNLFYFYKFCLILLTQYHYYIKIVLYGPFVFLGGFFGSAFITGIIQGILGPEKTEQLGAQIVSATGIIKSALGLSISSDVVIETFTILFFVFLTLAIIIRPAILAQAETDKKVSDWARDAPNHNAQQLEEIKNCCFRIEFINSDRLIQSSYDARLFFSQICDAVKLISAQFA